MLDSPGSPGSVVQYSTFLEVRERRRRVAAELVRQADAPPEDSDTPPTVDAEAVKLAQAAAVPHSDR
jgi:hypothetical protein